MAIGRPDSVVQNLEDLRQDNRNRERMKVTATGPSVYQIIQSQAIEDTDIEAGDTLDQWYLPDEGFVVIDLESGGDE